MDGLTSLASGGPRYGGLAQLASPSGISPFNVAGRVGKLGYKQALNALGVGGMGMAVAEQVPDMAREYYETGSVVEPMKSLVAALASQAAMGLITPEEFRWQLSKLIGSTGSAASPIDDLMRAMQPGTAP